MKKFITSLTMAVCCALIPAAQETQTELTKAELGTRDIERAMKIIDITWNKCMKGSATNLRMSDRYNTTYGFCEGTSDIWPLTAAIEAHNSLLEALTVSKEIDPTLYDTYYSKYSNRLDMIIDNLDYYRGTYTLASYAVNRQVSPFAVPRSSTRNGADVTGILNVYDDQMWLCRELIRAYRLTGTEKYLELAVYLAEYVIEGWDCWRDSNGEEYGGITWGPGYNSKHACSNAPIIQPLVWLYELYKDEPLTTTYYYRDADNNVVEEEVNMASHFLNFAKKVYAWQRKHLLNTSGVYWDMMGADGTIKVNRGYRQHVDCGGHTGNFYSYNTGTMIAGGADLYRVTGDESYRDETSASCQGALSTFSSYRRIYKAYVFKTDAVATEGFNTWFNDVLFRGYVDAEPYCTNNTATSAIESFQTALDYGFENFNRDNMLPIKLFEGWGDEVVTKPFHQFAFVSEYGVLAKRLLKAHIEEMSAIEAVETDSSDAAATPADDEPVYNLGGVYLGTFGKVAGSLPRGLYIAGGRKISLGI